MNERIRELAEQALDIVSNKRMLKGGQLERTWDPHEYDQVFAELIVQECLYLCESTAAGQDAEAIQEAIQQHFGVEQ